MRHNVIKLIWTQLQKRDFERLLIRNIGDADRSFPQAAVRFQYLLKSVLQT